MGKQQEPAEGDEDEKGVDWRKVHTHLGLARRIRRSSRMNHRQKRNKWLLLCPYSIESQPPAFNYTAQEKTCMDLGKGALTRIPNAKRRRLSRTSWMRFSAISLRCSRPSVLGKISTKAPKSTSRTTLPRYVLPISAVAVRSLMIWIA